MSILQSVIDTSTHAMLIMDSDGIITHVNNKIKTCFGLINLNQYSHPAGRIERGDVIIIADSYLGGDDGKLSPSDLATIGIQPGKVRSGDSLVAIGRFQDPSFSPLYKSIPGTANQELQLKSLWNGISIKAELSGNKSEISVGDLSYSMTYFLNIGQLVVVDGKTGLVKFWQDKGYSVRKEGIGYLLRGAEFQAKAPGLELDIRGEKYTKYFEGKEFVCDVDAVISGKEPGLSDRDYVVNGFPLVASIFPAKNGDDVKGIIVKCQKIDDIKTSIMERNLAIKRAEKMYQEIEKTLALEPPESFSGLSGSSTAMGKVRRQAYKLSQLDCNILITGESGTGKSFLADSIVKVQKRRGPFVRVDCTTIAPTLFESEMFGYVPGSFTGASAKGQEGFFEAANHGTIFLDEIGEIPINIQAKLLRVMQNKEICRVGSTKLIPIDVRILAATNRELKKEVDEGRFRRDLYYRLSAFCLELPPLRECQEDLCFIIDNLMDKLRIKYQMPEKVLSGEAFGKLLAYDWPGNIRELENVLERAVALSESDIIYSEQIHLESELPFSGTLKDHLTAEEKKMIVQTLAQCGGDKKEAMAALGLSKSVFYAKLKRHGLA